MSDSVVLVDFGASRVKAIHWSLKHGRCISSRECAAPILRRGAQGEAEGDPESYWEALEATAGQFVSADANVQDMWLCSEMHGFLLVSPSGVVPLTPYISWQDQRACGVRRGESMLMDLLQESLAPVLMLESGLRLRPGLPIVNLAANKAQFADLGPARLMTLVDWLLVRGGEVAPRCHPSMAAGTGFYSLITGSWSDKLMRLAGVDPHALSMPVLQSDPGAPLGKVRLGGRVVNLWGGVGDLQAAAHGAGLPRVSSVFINLGTGSQVLAATTQAAKNVEVRQCVGGEFLHAITHIPSGRALNTYAAFIDQCACDGGGEKLFWRRFSELKAEDVLSADPSIDLNVFGAAWRYSGGGSISHVNEGKFSLGWFMHSLARSWLTQYADALQSFAVQPPGLTFIVGGGLSRRASFTSPVLEALLGRKVVQVNLRTGEETLDGLLTLAESAQQ